MWLITLRDLQWRRRRFAIAIGATALVFAMTLVLAGLAASFRSEVSRTVGAVDADSWIVSDSVAGPFTAFSSIPGSAAEQIAGLPGVKRADPLIILRQTVRVDGTLEDVNLIGHRAGGLGTPPVDAGRSARASGELVVDESAGLSIGQKLSVTGRPFTVVGTTTGLTYYAGKANIYMTIDDARVMAFQGRDVATTIVTRGVPRSTPKGFQALSPEEAEADVIRPLYEAISAIDMVQMLLWTVAAAIIGSVVYLSALERVRDFAVLKATGASSSGLYVGLALQAIAVSLAGAVGALGLAQILAPVFPLPVQIPVGSVALLPAVALIVGLLASIAGMRRAVSADPALAFGGAA